MMIMPNIAPTMIPAFAAVLRPLGAATGAFGFGFEVEGVGEETDVTEDETKVAAEETDVLVVNV